MVISLHVDLLKVVMEEKVQLGEAVNKQLDLHRNLLEQLNQLELNQLSGNLILGANNGER